MKTRERQKQIKDSYSNELVFVVQPETIMILRSLSHIITIVSNGGFVLV